MAFTPKQITKELDMANLAKHNDNYNAIKTELDTQASAVATHTAAQTAHGSTSEAVAGKIMQRDSEGRAKVGAPAAADDIARKAEVDAVQGALDTHEADADVHLSAADRTKLDGVGDGAEPNQNAFAQVNDVVAGAESDTLTIAGGTGITVTTNPTTKTVTVTATGDATPGAHGPSHNNDGADPIPDLVALRGEFDSLTAADIGAETPAGAQAKVDTLAGVGNTQTVAEVAESVADVAAQLAETVQKGSIVLNVKDFGAAGDGIVDDTEAIQSAISEALALRSGGIVYLPPGSYNVSEPLDIEGTLSLVGAGRFQTLIRATANINILNVSGDYVEISGLSTAYEVEFFGVTALNITGTGFKGSDIIIRGCDYGFSLINISNANFINVQVNDYKSSGFYIESSNDIFVTNFLLHAGNTSNGQLGGIRLYNRAEAVVFSNGDVLSGVYSLTTEADANSFGARPAYSKFANVYFDSATNGVSLSNSVSLVFDSCWFSNRPGPGVVIGTTDDISFNVCHFVNNGSSGAELLGGAKRIKFIGCSFISNNATDIGAHGLWIGPNVTDFMVKECTFTNALNFSGQQQYGVIVNSGTSDRYIIADNLVSGNAVGGVSDGGSGTNKRVDNNF